MYRSRSQRRLEKGNRVRLICDKSSMGEGTVLWIGMVQRSYRYHHEDFSTESIVERIPCAKVSFSAGEQMVEITQLISCNQVQRYESLEAGDLVVYGRNKKAHAIVLSNIPRRRVRNGITATDRSITVLENGVRKRLSLYHDILMIQKARDCLHYS